MPPHSTSQPSSPRTASSHGRRTPALRRAPTSHQKTSTPNSRMYHSALHLTDIAQPIISAPASRHHGTANAGRPPRSGSTPASSARSQRNRRWSRSTTRQANAASTKNITKMSSSAVRDSTKCSPSRVISRPAAQPSVVERNIRRPSRMTISTERMPATAEAIRQPNSFSPKMPCAQPMSHLPSGGCTTKSPVLVLWFHSTPWWIRSWPSGA